MKIDMDTCEEILITITRNKTRSLLTAFGVFWGIFMLVALIGGGQGLEEMMKKNFEGFATNSGFLAAQRTGEAYKGFRKGRWWDLEATDINRLRSQVKEAEVITPSAARWGSKAVYEDKKYDCSVKGLYPDYLHIESQEIAYGRFINDVDIKEARKVCVIGEKNLRESFQAGRRSVWQIHTCGWNLLPSHRNVCFRRKHEHTRTVFGGGHPSFYYHATDLQSGRAD